MRRQEKHVHSKPNPSGRSVRSVPSRPTLRQTVSAIDVQTPANSQSSQVPLLIASSSHRRARLPYNRPARPSLKGKSGGSAARGTRDLRRRDTARRVRPEHATREEDGAENSAAESLHHVSTSPPPMLHCRYGGRRNMCRDGVSGRTRPAFVVAGCRPVLRVARPVLMRSVLAFGDGRQDAAIARAQRRPLVPRASRSCRAGESQCSRV